MADKRQTPKTGQILSSGARMSAFWADERGSVPIEYGIIAVAMVVAVAATIWTIGDEVVAMFTAVATGLGVGP